MSNLSFPGRKWLLLGVLVSLSFLFYGSLVPLEFKYVPVGQAWSEFKTLMSKGLFVGSRVDLGENFLLMIPVGFFGFGLIWPENNRGLVLPFAVLVLAFCFCASYLIEFSQMFFKERIPAFSDVLMQSLGAAAGIFAWRMWGFKIWPRFFQGHQSSQKTSIVEKIFWIYLIGLFGYNITPFNITVNPYWIYKKYQAGGIILIPFTHAYGHWGSLVYSLATDIIIWAPVGFLWVMRKGKKPGMVFLWTFIAVVAVESVQLFIASRTFDVTDIILGALGGGIGVFLCLNFPFLNLELPEGNEAIKDKHNLFLIGLGVTILWCLVLAIVFWFPYEVRIEHGFITSQLNRFFNVPFYVYYYSGGLTALTAVFQKTLFFIPLGTALAITSQSFRKYGVNSLLTLIAVACVAGMGLVIELGQALMPNKIPDSTDLLFETIGGVTGYWLTMIYFKKKYD